MGIPFPAEITRRELLSHLVTISSSKSQGNPISQTVQSQEDRVLTLAREYLDKRILGTPGGSAKWNLKAHRVDDVWVVPIPDDVRNGMPGGFPEKVIVDLEKNTVTRSPSE